MDVTKTVTAGVNMHSYTGQYYQPPEEHYPQLNGGRPPRNGRGHLNSGNKRVPNQMDRCPSVLSLPESAPVKKTLSPVEIKAPEKITLNITKSWASLFDKTPTSSQTSHVKEIIVQKEKTPPMPVHTSPFAEDPNCYGMGEFIVRYTIEHNAVGLVPRGLTNRSNYCYVNAILQALIACPPFYNMLKAFPYQTRRVSSTPVIDSLVQLCNEFSALSSSDHNMTRVGRGSKSKGVATLNIPAGRPLEGGVGLKVLHALKHFVGAYDGRQQDAEEFLSCLLNSLNDEMLELIKLIVPDDKEARRTRTPVSAIFRGWTRISLHKTIQNEVTHVVQPFFTLQLDIERSSSVKNALELLANKETLDGVADAWHQLSLEELPAVLLLHLKCFQLGPGGAPTKILKKINYPIDLKIDPKIMSSKSKNNPKERTYKLFAIVYHEGFEAVKGHYLTDTFHGQAGWMRCNDSTITHVSTSQVLKHELPRMPYLLMYRRLDTLPQK